MKPAEIDGLDTMLGIDFIDGIKEPRFLRVLKK